MVLRNVDVDKFDVNPPQKTAIHGGMLFIAVRICISILTGITTWISMLTMFAAYASHVDMQTRGLLLLIIVLDILWIALSVVALVLLFRRQKAFLPFYIGAILSILVYYCVSGSMSYACGLMVVEPIFIAYLFCSCNASLTLGIETPLQRAALQAQALKSLDEKTSRIHYLQRTFRAYREGELPEEEFLRRKARCLKKL